METVKLEIDEIICDKIESFQHLYKVRTNVPNIELWLPYAKIPSSDLILNYTLRLMGRLSRRRDKVHVDEACRKIYDILYESHDNELDSLFKEFVTMSGVALPASRKDDVLQELITFVRNADLNKNVLRKLRRDILIEKLLVEREKQLINLKESEFQINIIGDHKKAIKITNDVDLSHFPSHLTYINRYLVIEDSIPDQVMIKCNCKSKQTCKTNDCYHYFRDDADKAQEMYENQIDGCNCYDDQGRVLTPVYTPIYECNKLCECDETCPKRVVQNGSNFQLEIFKTFNDCGWGVRTLERIPCRSFVTRYAGEVIPWVESNRQGRCQEYLFDVDFYFDPKTKHCPYTIDAYKYGNVSRFINHSCDPNLSIHVVYIENIFLELPEIAFFASRDIEAGEELNINYIKLVKKIHGKCRCAHCAN